MKIGLALGGGGAKGFAHIGVLRVLLEAGIKIDVVAGTSVGALIGAVFADESLDRFELEVQKIRLTEIPLLLSPAWSKQGLFSGNNALDKLSEVLRAKTIEDLKKPFAAVSVDLNSGSVVTFTAGDLQRAIRASISIPAIFTPVAIENMLLIDGGTLEPVPVEAARKLGADFVIAVDLFGNPAGGASEERRTLFDEKLLPQPINNAIQYLRSISAKTPLADRLDPKDVNRDPVPSVIEIIERTLRVYQRSITASRLAAYPPDLLVQPAVSDIGLLDFHRGEHGVARGLTAGKEALAELQKLLQRG